VGHNYQRYTLIKQGLKDVPVVFGAPKQEVEMLMRLRPLISYKIQEEEQ